MRPSSRRPGILPELLLLWVALLWVPLANRGFISAALQGHDWARPATWGFALALVAALVAAHYIILGLLAWGRLTKPVVLVLLVVAAVASHYVHAWGAYLNPSMLRNAAHTQWTEARELLGLPLVMALVIGAVLPGWWVWRQPLRSRSAFRALGWRLGTLVLALVVLAGCVFAVYQPLASLMRNNRDLRYRITPANVLYSSVQVLRQDLRGAAKPREAVGTDATLGPEFPVGGRPAVVVVVVGETARAANWGLNGYARNTTPELAKLPVINFPNVRSCGTDTETSVPCMFSAIGRRDYDEDRIRGSQSLLHVAAHAGVGVLWRDNQSGCKGVCEGLPYEQAATGAPPALCKDGNCFDEVLLQGLDQRLTAARGPQLLVLHQLGNHGPAYYRRVPPAFARFQPMCTEDDLRRCSPESIVNAYDNALLYTDHILAQLVKQLQALSPTVDTALIYVSDHGESLGEKGLMLHGVPQAIAPDEQTHVPMIMWLSEGFAQRRGVDIACLKQRAQQATSHDNLFHTVLGLLDVRTHVREPAWDLAATCSAAPAAGVAASAPAGTLAASAPAAAAAPASGPASAASR